MKFCTKIFLFVALSAVVVAVRASNDSLVEYKEIQQECMKIVDENAELRKEVFRLKGKILDLKMRLNENAPRQDVAEIERFPSASVESLVAAMNGIKNETSTLAEIMKNFLPKIGQFKEFQPVEPPNNCADAAKGAVGVYLISLPGSESPAVPVYCDDQSWMVILRRVDDTVDFNRNWTEYKSGFGDIEGNYMMGLERIHQVTHAQCQQLQVALEDSSGEKYHVWYNQFRIDDESHDYALTTLGDFSGNSGDVFRYTHGMKFSTVDRDNDLLLQRNCAEEDGGGWWFAACGTNNLTGKYNAKHNSTSCRGLCWNYESNWKSVKMLMKPIDC